MSWDTESKSSQRPHPLDRHTHTHTQFRVLKFSVMGAQIVKINPNSDKTAKELRDHIFWGMIFRCYKDLPPRMLGSLSWESM